MFTGDTNLLICSRLNICDISNLLRTCTCINGALAKHIVIEKSLRQHMPLHVTIQSRKINRLHLEEHIILQENVINPVGCDFYPVFIDSPLTVIQPKHALYVLYANNNLCARVILLIIHHERGQVYTYVYDEYTDILDLLYYWQNAFDENRTPRMDGWNCAAANKINRFIYAYRERKNIDDHLVICCDREVIEFIRNI